ncbi:MAG: twin-arginine translocase TatA/TatE family subunit [Rhodospirillaceae bacterium]|jgi:sec-independent protein translocase protein TatA|nr:twin-arginine translocase TatA/TatE family subunit [Rhodospirillaceae bacterium]MBT3885933.1 twin-arginine translocase TatA/TatE family subunit [Rhodospirillaceae bacterium]MBT4115263.1 twin-arginine translocase TatA/TatE family subunit [Rhodospirillaceae bacterium]MBT4671159.1 twin-arginine translocase TatA/TatE family subunit [Rhodospirillaceae bacterium]MBT4720607.1 twin-arginine translocase TatA/TatE family subunit [Rhodospirillaceae bacterium]
MGTFSIWHWLVVLAVVLVLFGGKGKISSLMGDFGKGLKSFKKGIKDDESIEDNKSEFSAESSVTDATEDQDKKTAEQA